MRTRPRCDQDLPRRRIQFRRAGFYWIATGGRALGPHGNSLADGEAVVFINRQVVDRERGAELLRRSRDKHSTCWNHEPFTAHVDYDTRQGSVFGMASSGALSPLDTLGPSLLTR